MTNRPGSRPSLRELQNALLDREYFRIMALVHQAMGRDFARDGVLGKRLADIEAKAAQLEAAGERMTLETPEVAAFLADYERGLKRYSSLLDAVAEPMMIAGITAGLTISQRVTLTGLEATAFAARWKRPATGVLTELVKYISKPEFRQRVDDYPSAVIKIISGVVRGKGPLATARELRKVSPGLSANGANSLMRTLQLTAYRDATAVNYLANADILEGYSIRIAALQVGRTCLACVALHGTRIPLGSRVDDHENGRCLLPGQTVETLDGPVAIEKIQQGDMVLTHEGRYRRVLATYSRMYDGEITKVANSTLSVFVTPDHQVLSRRGWVAAKDLSALDTLVTLNDVLVRVSSRKTTQPNSINRLSRFASAGRRLAVLCHRESSSTSSLNSGKAKSRLYTSTASCGTGDNPTRASALRNSISPALQKVSQFCIRRSARLREAIGDAAARASRFKNSGSRSTMRAIMVDAPVADIPHSFMSFMSERVLIPASPVNSRIVDFPTTYRRVIHSQIGSPSFISSLSRHLRDLIFPASASRRNPILAARGNMDILVRPGSIAAISLAVHSLWKRLITSSSSGDHRLPAIGHPFFIATIIHHDDVNTTQETYSGKVYDLEVEEDHSYIAGGIVVHNCTSIAVVRGRPANVQSGISWFGGLTPDQQRKMAGPSAYEAIKRGDATLPDFVGKRTDPIFGPMIQEKSLKGLFGPAAQDYYKQARLDANAR